MHNRLTGQKSLAQENAGSFSQMAKESTGESPRNFHKATVSLRKILRSFAKFDLMTSSRTNTISAKPGKQHISKDSFNTICNEKDDQLILKRLKSLSGFESRRKTSANDWKNNVGQLRAI